MAAAATILLVDDEDSVQKLLTYPLERDGFKVVHARDGEEALARFAEEEIDLVVLDLMLPRLDGLEVCKRLRATSSVPIIMLTARDDELDKVLGLELGADDYITKPFSIREFRSRVRALLRRAAAPRPGERRDDEVIEAGELTIDVPRRTVEVRGEEAQLTFVEFELLRVLASAPGRVFSRRQLLERLRGIRLRLALALLVVVAGSLAVVYLIVVPSLEAELIDAKVDQLEEDASSVVRTGGIRLGSEQAFAENAASLVQARVVVYLLQDQLFIMGDSNTSQLSVDVARDPIARRASLTGRIQRGTVERGGRRFGEVAVPLEREGVVVLLSDSLADPISSLNLIERRLLFAGLIALIFAVVTGYAAASLHARRIRRLERAAERIADGRFDEPVVDRGNDELGDLASAFERMRIRLEKLDRARSEFIANASHELRTPLFSLGGFLELMDDEDVDDATRQEFLATMREQVDRLAKLATDLLDLSRLDARRVRVEHEPVDPREVARTVA